MKVFISYSRVDAAFAEKLRHELIGRGFEAYLDKEDILPGEPWRARIDGLILAADAVVFVISPSSIASEVCCWEVGRALELKKSLTPLYWCVVGRLLFVNGDIWFLPNATRAPESTGKLNCRHPVLMGAGSQ